MWLIAQAFDDRIDVAFDLEDRFRLRVGRRVLDRRPIARQVQMAVAVDQSRRDPGPAERHDLAALEHAQQLGLQLQG